MPDCKDTVSLGLFILASDRSATLESQKNSLQRGSELLDWSLKLTPE